MNSHEILSKYPAVPLSKQLLNFIDSHGDFEASLKISSYPRFIFLPRIILSYPPNSEDEIIGMFYYDSKECMFKQDYIVNLKFKHKDYISYTALNQNIKASDHVKGIEEFFIRYGSWDGTKGNFYCRKYGAKKWMHHYCGIKDLPDDAVLRSIAGGICKKANKNE